MALRKLARQVRDLPLLRSAFLRWRQQQFLSSAGYGRHFGLYQSFKEARESLPPRPDFDHAALATEYVEVRTKKVFPYDYPVMWWLDKALKEGSRSVLDIGGSVGVHYYAYRRYIDMPDDLRWHVVEVPSMVSIGQDLAMRHGVDALHFHSRLDEPIASGTHEIWISAGAIHCLEEGRPDQLLQQCARRPDHILLNKLPLYAGDDFVTVQNIGEGAFAPVHIYNGDRFIQRIRALGYTLRDRWAVPERSMYLPGHPQRFCSSFTGLYFIKDSDRIPAA